MTPSMPARRRRIAKRLLWIERRLVWLIALLLVAHVAYVAAHPAVVAYRPAALPSWLQWLRPQGVSTVAEPPWHALQRVGMTAPVGERHGLGLRQAGGSQAARPLLGGVLPLSVDISQYVPPVGDQGDINDCASWALGYYLRGWYAKRDGQEPASGFAPLYLYSQASGGLDQGSSFEDNVALLHRQGIDSGRDYRHGPHDFRTPPTRHERARAKRWRVLGWHFLFEGPHQGAAGRLAIEQALAGGNPVALGIPVYTNFYNAGPRTFYIKGAKGDLLGGHAVTALKYDPNGLWIVNQWGTSWGLNGYSELSWSFIQKHAFEAATLNVPMPHIVQKGAPAHAHPKAKKRAAPRPGSN